MAAPFQSFEKKKLKERLLSIETFLGQNFGDRLVFMRQAGSQGNSAVEALAKRGEFSQHNLIASLWTNAGHVRQLGTIMFVAALAFSRSSVVARNQYDNGDLLGFYWGLRGILERVAHIHYLRIEMEKAKAKADNIETKAAHPFLETFEHDPAIRNSLYGTTVKWNDLAFKSLKEPSVRKLVGKATKDSLGAHFATQVLNKIDTLEKSVAGVRASYELLCDYLHPNVGDMLACTSDYIESTDRNGVKMIKRVLGNGISPVATVDQVVMERVCAILTEALNQFEADLILLINIRDNLDHLLRDYNRSIIKKYRPYFRMNDLCTCASGKPIKTCCGKGINLDV